jgi:hypothetical protein
MRGKNEHCPYCFSASQEQIKAIFEFLPKYLYHTVIGVTQLNAEKQPIKKLKLIKKVPRA